jgi:hypothetical protein
MAPFVRTKRSEVAKSQRWPDFEGMEGFRMGDLLDVLLAHILASR